MGSDDHFQQLANGSFQANGVIIAQLNPSLSYYPVITISQIYSRETVSFFVRLFYTLNCVGTLNVHNSSGNLIITYRISDWDAFFNGFRAYFTMLHGLKHNTFVN